MRLIAPASAIHAGPNPKYFGQARGVTLVNLLSNQFCGNYFQEMIKTRAPNTIIGNPTHSWQIGDPTFTQDLSYTLQGARDRRAIPTRDPLPNGQFQLSEAATPVASAPTTPMPVTPT